MTAAVTNVWRQLVQRRLWPVAIVLVAALAAVPLLLAKEPESSADPVPVATGADEENLLATQPIVSAATPADFARRHVLGDKKNPFHVEKPAKEETAEKSSTGTNPAPDQGTGGTGGSTGSSPDAPSGGGGPVPSPGVPTTPGTPVDPTPAKTYDKYDLTVRFGDSSAQPERMTLPRLQPLPKEELPVLIYLGVSKDGKSAMFLLEKGVQAVGDGVCDPNPEDCETLRLRVGETEFLDVVDEQGNVTSQYQLDLVKIHKATTSSAAAATASSKRGRELLARRASSSGRPAYRFDASSGTLERRAGAVGAVARTTASIG